MNSSKKYFTKTLMRWDSKYNKRSMPWKGERDPYRIWLSEIILQQTRVEQGLDYYNRFIKAYPTVEKLAKAPQEKVFKLWEGLGYYTRCKNLIETARFIAKKKNGKFPDAYHDILALKGVGPYTAAAIASFAFDLPHAVVDGNVYRVLSRFFGINTAVDSIEGKKIFGTLAAELLDKERPGAYNQALMDFGAVICKPPKPLCDSCPLQKRCLAKKEGLTEKLPAKSVKAKKRSRWFYFLVVKHNDRIYVRKREAKDIWENLYEFILLETKKKMTVERLKHMPGFKEITAEGKMKLTGISKPYRQQLSHQTIEGRFLYLDAKETRHVKGYKAVHFKDLKKLPFPRIITAWLTENEAGHLTDKNVSLNLL